MPTDLDILKALSNENRLLIMKWISTPQDHFPEQRDGDLIDDGVCVGFITQKIGLSQPTVTSHMKILEGAGLVSGKPIKNWVFYKPNKVLISEMFRTLSDQIGD
jgi:ArsR family transcriptional regulator